MPSPDASATRTTSRNRSPECVQQLRRQGDLRSFDVQVDRNLHHALQQHRCTKIRPARKVVLLTLAKAQATKSGYEGAVTNLVTGRNLGMCEGHNV